MTENIPCPPISRPNGSAGTLDLSAIKTRQQAMWASGDFAIIGTTLQIVGETLCETADVRAGRAVLDVAAGNGNAALAAARRFAQVTAVDYVPALLARAADRAAAERVNVRFVEGDAERLPFEDRSFDYVLSTFGVMFAPDQPRAASELLRVCRPGGKIALANWTPEGFIGRLLGVVGRYVSPPAGLPSPILWGTQSRLRELFGESNAKISTTRRDFNFRYESPEHFVDVLRRYYGPTHMAFRALDLAQQSALAAEMVTLIDANNQAGRDSVVVPAEYLEIVIEKPAQG
jgi:SAM-dependent methyltransferase